MRHGAAWTRPTHRTPVSCGSALSRHRHGEDDGLFPVLAEQIPELRPVLEQLRHDHDVVVGLLRSVEDVVGGLGPHPP
jgi:hypothetical protein